MEGIKEGGGIPTSNPFDIFESFFGGFGRRDKGSKKDRI